ncbi:MAG TPA: AMP-binding protein [Polyangiaceae bacterium]|nr:AMP-binding protein [Polyangiaceae bacterium]
MPAPLPLDSAERNSPLLARLLALRSSDRVALIDPRGSVTFQAVAERACQIAAQLSQQGLAGCRVALSSSPDREWVEAFWGILLAGSSVVPISPLHPAPERDYFLRRSGARAQLVSAGLASSLPEGAVPRLVFEAGRLLGQLSPAAPELPAALPPAALLLYTSGTTGQPKGVPLSHGNVWAGIETLSRDWGISSADRLLHALPLHHVHGIIVALLCAFCSGASTELLPRYEPARVLEALARASVLMSVPTQHKRLIDHLDGLPAAERAMHERSLRALRLITSGSAKLPEQLGRRLEALSGQYPLERYGMTEIGIVIGNPLAASGRKPGSCGRPLPGMQIRIVDEAGVEIPPAVAAERQSGEIWVSGASVFEGYDGEPEATRGAFAAGFFKTGDTARWTPDGFVEILGRTSVDIIKSGGYKLSAIEIEEQLRGHPWVNDVAVLGVPDDTWGERVVAVAIPSPSARRELDQRDPLEVGEELRGWLKQRMAGYQVPKHIAWWTELPRNALGKVQKPELLKRWLQLDATAGGRE